jgi:hypothetical protein
MPIFGQVWLWSLLAFLLGALVLWLLMVLPVRRRISELERRLAALRKEPRSDPPAERPSSPALSTRSEPAFVPGFGDRDYGDEIPSESLTRAYALPSQPESPYSPPESDPEERGALRLAPEEPVRDVTQVLGSPPVAAELPVGGRDWFDDVPPDEPRSRGEHRLIEDEDEDDEDRGTIFTQRTTPIPAELIRNLDEVARAEESRDSLVDDLDDLDEEDADEPAEAEEEPLSVGRHGQAPEPESEPEDDEPEPVHANGTAPAPEEHHEPEPTPKPMPMPMPMPTSHRSDDRISLVGQRTPTAELAPQSTIGRGVTVEPERTQSALPKRIPAKPQHRVPFGVQTVSATATAGGTAAGGERARSLFEPVIPADGTGESAVLPPPPHRLRSADSSRPSPPGPFGPGSAMPLPGGASPSPEFTIKASVTALRYCTPDSPQFGRTVAEVWFRSAADAERVGFRPVG